MTKTTMPEMTLKMAEIELKSAAALGAADAVFAQFTQFSVGPTLQPSSTTIVLFLQIHRH